MTVRFLVLVLVVLAFAGLPSVEAQQPVDRCTHQCEPTSIDVNPNAPVSSGPINVILYGHLQHAIGWGTMNLVPPNPDYENDLNSGSTMPGIDTSTGFCPPDLPCADFHFQNGIFRMEFCPGAIQFISADEWFMGCHASRSPLPLEVTAPPTVYFYLSADAAPSNTAESPPIGAGVLPNVRIRASLLEWGTETRATIAEGWSEPGVLMSVPGREQVYEFRADLQSLAVDGRLALGKGGVQPKRLELEIEIQQITATDPDIRVAQRDWRIHTGPDFPPRVILQVDGPLVQHRLMTTTFQGVSYARYSIQSAFGSYEFDVDQVEAKIVTGNKVSVPDDALEFLVMKRSLDHDGMLLPVNFTWRVHPEHFPDEGTDYSVVVSSTNLQGTYRVTDAAKLEIHDFDGVASIPNVPLFVSLLVLGVVFHFRRPWK